MEKDTQYKINYYFDEEDGFYHIKVYGVETRKQYACLYAKDKNALSRDVKALKDIYNIFNVEKKILNNIC